MFLILIFIVCHTVYTGRFYLEFPYVLNLLICIWLISCSGTWKLYFLKNQNFIIVGLNIIIILNIILAVVFRMASLFFNNAALPFKKFLLGTYTNPTMLSDYLLVLLPFVLFSTLSRNNRIKLLSTISVLLINLVFIYNNSRTSIIGSAAVIVIYLYYNNKNNLTKYIFLSILSILILCICFILISYYKSDSTNGHLLILKISLSLLRNNIFLGSGYGTYPYLYPIAQAKYFEKYKNLKEILLADDNYVCHNEFVESSIEFGLFIIILFIILLSYSIYKRVKGFAKRTFVLYLWLAWISVVLILLSTSYPFRCVGIYQIIFGTCFYFESIFGSYIVKPNQPAKVDYLKYTLFLFGLLATIYMSLYNIALKKWEYDFKNYLATNKKLHNSFINTLENNSSYLFTSSVYYLRRKEYEKAIKYCDESMKLQSGSRLYLLRGKIYQDSGLYINAYDNYYTASLITPHKARPKFLLMNLCADSKNTAQAKYWANQVILTPVKIKSIEREIMNRKAHRVLTY